MLNMQQQKDFAKWRDSALILAKTKWPSITVHQAATTIGAGLWAALEFFKEHPEATPDSVLEYMQAENALDKN